ncbi:MAG: anhydro-N-acetylmuramic acid kinase [Bacteroidota bacterium]
MEVHRILGLMSGTSLDGLDMAMCQFQQTENGWQFRLIGAETISYSEDWVNRLGSAVDLGAAALEQLHVDFGTLMARLAVGFLKRTPISPSCVASHGHTVFHQPGNRFTTQIGHGQEMANIIGIPVVCDFRSNDVLLGGQGAPLVPIGDELLFGDYDACLNLGGFSNISFRKNGKRKAFDMGPVNMLLNHLARKRDLAYDKDGLLAQSGNLDEDLLRSLNHLAYYEQDIPKSLGFEWFSEVILPFFEASNLSVEDQLKTAVEHVAWTIASQFQRFGNPEATCLMVTGGGTHNAYLVHRIKALLPDHIEVIVPDQDIVDYKEAIIFAFMGLLRQLGQVNCLASVTGASRDSSSGTLFFPS